MKLLAIRLSAFGDVIHTIPAVVALRDLGHDVVWVVERPYRDLVALVARVDTISVSMKEWGRAFVASRGEMFAARAAMRSFARETHASEADLISPWKSIARGRRASSSTAA